MIPRKRIAQIIRLATGGVAVSDISVELGLNKEQVRYVLREWGIRSIDPRRVDSERLAAAVQAVKQGSWVVDAAIDHDVSLASLDRALQHHKVRASTTNRGRMTGSVARALARVAARQSVVDACRVERCATSTVYAILKRRRAKNLPR